jgi:hypothetical protein
MLLIGAVLLTPYPSPLRSPLSSEYRDYSNLMSGAIVGVHDKTRGPLECYNAAAHRLLGWYADKSKTIYDLNSESGLYQIAAFVDYSVTNAAVQYNIISIGDTLHMQWNRRKKHNSGTYSHIDELVLIQDTPYVRSGNWVYATLIANPSTVIVNTPDAGRIEVCGACYSADDSTYADYLLVSISSYNGASYCISASCSVPSSTMSTAIDWGEPSQDITMETVVMQQMSLSGNSTTTIMMTEEQSACLQESYFCTSDAECCSFLCWEFHCQESTDWP